MSRRPTDPLQFLTKVALKALEVYSKHETLGAVRDVIRLVLSLFS